MHLLFGLSPSKYCSRVQREKKNCMTWSNDLEIEHKQAISEVLLVYN